MQNAAECEELCNSHMRCRQELPVDDLSIE